MCIRSAVKNVFDEYERCVQGHECAAYGKMYFSRTPLIHYKRKSQHYLIAVLLHL